MTQANDRWLAEAADRCVSCGLCIPQCPTWQVRRNEADSPRGRIMIMQQFAATQTAPDSGAAHLDACLGCGRCEQVCPVNVPFTAMLAYAKTRLPARRSWPAQLLIQLAAWPGRELLLGGVLRALRALRWLRLSAVLPQSLRTLVELAPQPKRNSKAQHQTDAGAEPAKASVALLSGCFNRTLDHDAFNATQTLLRKCGYQVSVPSRQQCCGAIAKHAGLHNAEQSCVHDNEQAFSNADYIATTASACAMQLCSLDSPLAQRSVEAGELIAKSAAALAGYAGNLNVMVHIPCSQSLLATSGQWVYALLEQLPNTQVICAPGNDVCCGSGGLTFLSHAQTAGELADRKIKLWRQQAQADTVIVSANHACRTHLNAALRRAGMEQRLMHPLTLVASQQLR